MSSLRERTAEENPSPRPRRAGTIQKEVDPKRRRCDTRSPCPNLFRPNRSRRRRVNHAANLDRHGGESILSKLAFFRLCPSTSNHAKVRHHPQLCHPERTPDFLLHGASQRPRMRLSVEKAARDYRHHEA